MALATPEASLGTALGVAVMTYGVFQLHLPPMADVRTCDTGNRDVHSMAKGAAWTSAAVVAGVSLITKDATVFTLGGAVTIALYWMYQHANAVSPLTGKVHNDQMTVGDLMGAQGGAAPDRGVQRLGRDLRGIRRRYLTVTTPTPGNTTVAAGSSGGILSDITNAASHLWDSTVLGNATSAYEATKAGVTDTASATEAVAEVVIQGAEWMANPHNWVRVGMVIIGGAVILIGVFVAFRDTGAGRATGATIKGGATLAAAA